MCDYRTLLLFLLLCAMYEKINFLLLQSFVDDSDRKFLSGQFLPSQRHNIFSQQNHWYFGGVFMCNDTNCILSFTCSGVANIMVCLSERL